MEGQVLILGPFEVVAEDLVDAVHMEERQWIEYGQVVLCNHLHVSLELVIDEDVNGFLDSLVGKQFQFVLA